jgi:GT2 family glycosyltransferase
VFASVGPLDEGFDVGMFEDDYARRVRDAGYRLVCDEAVFVHHFGEASLGELAGDGRDGEMFDANRRRFEEKRNLRGPVDKLAEAAGAELTEARQIDGRHDVFVRRYRR